MHIILGATGHVGSVVAENLLKKNEEVLVITHDPSKAKAWEEKGAQVAVVNVLDTDKLREVFNKGRRLFLLNPPGNSAKNSVAEERHTMRSILMALEDSYIKRVVAESTYGAQEGRGIGDLGILYDMEIEIKNIFLPHNIIRAAYYMTNWDASLQSAQEDGVIYTLYPTDFKIPMVSPIDIGNIASELMLQTEGADRPHYIEGPEEYSAADVAVAFSEHLRLPVKAVTIPQEKWVEALQNMGFSKESALSMAAMTDIVLKGEYEKPRAPNRGKITLNEHVASLVGTQENIVQGLSNSF